MLSGGAAAKFTCQCLTGICWHVGGVVENRGLQQQRAGTDNEQHRAGTRQDRPRLAGNSAPQPPLPPKSCNAGCYLNFSSHALELTSRASCHIRFWAAACSDVQVQISRHVDSILGNDGSATTSLVTLAGFTRVQYQKACKTQPDEVTHAAFLTNLALRCISASPISLRLACLSV